MGNVRLRSVPRALFGAAAIVFTGAVLAGPAAAIAPPSDPDPAPGATFAITSTVPSVISSSSLTVEGVAGAGEAVTVEAVGAGNDTCGAVASTTGYWYCVLTLTQQDNVTIQAYREGGAFLEDYDERTAATVFPPDLTVPPGGLRWNASTPQHLSGTRYAFNQIDVTIDGNAGVCVVDSPSSGPTDWGCTIATPLSEGYHVVSVTQTGFLPSATTSAPRTAILNVDYTAPEQASISEPLTVDGAPGFPLPTVQSTWAWPFISGWAEPGTDVVVYWAPGDAYDPNFDVSSSVYCAATTGEGSDWSCSNDTGFSTGDVISFGTQVIDSAGNASPLTQQFAIEFIDGPVAPTITSPADGLVTFSQNLNLSGTSVYGDYVTVYLDGEFELCASLWAIDGIWTCAAGPLSLGTHTITVITGAGPTTLADTITVTIASPPPPTPPAPPASPNTGTTAPPAPLSWEYGLTDAQGNPVGPSFVAGDTVIITASGLPAGSTATAELHSDPIVLGSTTVASDGTLRLPVTIPAGVEPGEHTLVVTLAPPGGVASPAERAVTVGAASADGGASPSQQPEPEQLAQVSPSPAPVDSADAGDGGASRGIGSPSSIGSTLQSLGDVQLNPTTVTVAGSVAVAFILLVALPAELLQSTVTANYGTAFAWLNPLRRRIAAVKSRMPGSLITGRFAGALAVGATALILGFSDPSFGLNWASLRLWAAIFASLYVVNVAVTAVLRAVALARYGVRSSIDPMPASLLIVAASVLVSRLAGIEPGFLFGLVVGVAFARELAKAEEGKLALLGASLMVGVGLIAWLAYSALPEGNGFVLNLARDVAAATTLEALGTILVALLPAAFLDGRGLYLWSRRAWAAAYVVAIAAFVLVVVPMADTWGEMRAPLFGWMTLFIGFATVAVAVWAIFRRIAMRAEAAEAEQEAQGEHADASAR